MLSLARTNRNHDGVHGTSRAAAAIVAVGVCVFAGCSEPAKPKQIAVTPAKDVPSMLRGTIGSEVEFQGIQPFICSGYGLVVGLNGTGGEELPESIAATMERQMGLQGIGKAGSTPGTAIEGKTPRQLLRDKNVAVVVVQASIPPGSPQGETFDVYVRAVNASSLEGGTLWTTDLRLGDPTTFGQVAPRIIAKAKGPIFINPFAEPGREDRGVTRSFGRVLDGGFVTSPLDIEMVLSTPSYQRVRSIASAINSRFPEGPGDPGPPARGRSGPDQATATGGTLALRVPNRYRREAADFLELVRHIQIDQGAPEQYARRYVEALKSEPYLAKNAAWCLEALGQKAVPFVRELYDYPEVAVRMAALTAGAGLNDPRAAAPLRELATKSEGAVQTRAIALLGKIDAGPVVDQQLRDLLSSDQLLVRVAAYEALAARAEKAQFARLSRAQRENPDRAGGRVSPTVLEMLARSSFTGGAIYGVNREVVEGKFLLDTVPYGEPLIYIAQQGKPRIVLFGKDPSLSRPAVINAWSDRLMIATESSDDSVRVYYRGANAEKPIVLQGQSKARLTELVKFLARKSDPNDPRPGLNFSYSEVVGVLHAAFVCNATAAAFTTETDKLKAQLLAAQSVNFPDRPENPDDLELVVFKKPDVLDQTSPAEPAATEPKIVPIVPPSPSEKKK